ncbi:MAG: response regulator, partial [Deltaproteobacteria bacterium]|nr:response regulator [Deltaproteobacteria bacterium]
MKILIVDDKEQDIYILQVLLEGHGYEVVAAANGAEALEKARRDPPDMIITDILMPVMDGFTLCREWKGDEHLKEIPFIFYTATYTDSKDEKLALRLGADRFIVKPVDPDEFINIIKGVIRDIEKGKIKPKKPVLEKEKEVFKLYSERLVKKLEKKMLELESDITERKQSEKALQKVNMTIKILGDCNQALVRATEELDLLNEMCMIIVKEGGYRLAWVGYAEQDENKTVRPVAQAGYEEGYLDMVNITWADTEQGRGPTGKVIRTGKPSILKNILTDPEYTPWRSEATKHGYESSIALPLIAEDLTLGALNIYAEEPDAFDTEEVKLLTELADGMAYGIMALRTHAERVQAQEALKESERYTRGLIESSLDALVTISAEAKITDVNHATELITGLSRNEIIGTNFSKYFTDPVAAERHYQKVFQDGHVQNYLLEIKHRDGKFTPVLYNASVYKDTQGRVAGAFAAARDISDFKRMEEQLLQAQKMEAIGTLAGGIAHDFNNILGAIIGYTEIASLQVAEDNKAKESLNEVLKAGRRARDLVKQILAFSRKGEQERIPVQISLIVKEALKLLRSSLPTTIEIRQNIESDTGIVEADPTQIHQILMNLCTNAGHAMREEGGVLEV